MTVCKVVTRHGLFNRNRNKTNESSIETGSPGHGYRDNDGCHGLFDVQRIAIIPAGWIVLVFAKAFPPGNGTGLGTATDLWPGLGLPSVCHAVWDGIDYPLYGFGEKIGALGIEQTHIYGPEVGILGIGLNFLFATVLWYWITRFGTKSVVSQPITAGSERC